jgi:hypothetical protein
LPSAWSLPLDFMVFLLWVNSSSFTQSPTMLIFCQTLHRN